MATEGELHVVVRCGGGGTEAVFVRSTRPFVAPRLLSGRTVAEACRLVPLLFSVCGRSQAIAAAAACEAALGWEPSPEVCEARTMLIAAESMQESSFQALVEWPRQLGLREEVSVVAEARRRIAVATAPTGGAIDPCVGAHDFVAGADTRRALGEAMAPVAAALFGSDAPTWSASAESGGLEHWARDGCTPTARCLAGAFRAPAFGAGDTAVLPAGNDRVAAEIAREMDLDPAFERAPHWRGTPAETGALARVASTPAVAALVRTHGRSVLARWTARLVELAALASGRVSGACGSVVLDRGAGLGWVETARGLLLHRVRVANGRIAAYRIVAPTEWNFHPDGALPRGLLGARFAGAESAGRAVRLLVQSLDPCVAARVEVTHA